MEISKKIRKNIITSKKHLAKCPTCNRKSTELFLPFCSKKCSELDLIKWLKDEYLIDLDSQKY